MSLTGLASNDAPPRRTIPLAIFLVSLLIVAGIAIAATSVYFEVRPSASSSASTVSVVDDLGRTVQVPLNPSRVVVLAPSIMDTMYRLGLRERVVGIGCTPSLSGGIYAEYTPNQTALWDLTPGLCVTDSPTLSVEELVNRTPDLVLASTITSATTVESISVTFGIPVVMINPSTLEGVLGDVRILGQIFPSVVTPADGLVTQLQRTLVTAESFDTNLTTYPNSTVAPTVLLSYYFDSAGYWTYGQGSFGDSLIALAGGDNLAASTPLEYPELNGSAVLNASPQVIIYGTSWNDAYVVSGETPQNWTQAPYWGQLTGSKFAVDIEVVSEIDPSMILALPMLQHDIYPSLAPAP
jgi:iron complex transport system substrate-binding protein